MTSELERIKENCVIVGDCWLWKGYAVDGKHPRMSVNGRLESVRRLVSEAFDGPLQNGVIVVGCCGDDRCVRCIKRTTFSRMRTGIRKPATTAMKIARVKQSKSSVTIEDIKFIRSSELNGRELDAIFGKSSGWAAAIRRGKIWKDAASPFARLGAR